MKKSSLGALVILGGIAMIGFTIITMFGKRE